MFLFSLLFLSPFFFFFFSPFFFLPHRKTASQPRPRAPAVDHIAPRGARTRVHSALATGGKARDLPLSHGRSRCALKSRRWPGRTVNRKGALCAPDTRISFPAGCSPNKMFRLFPDKGSKKKEPTTLKLLRYVCPSNFTSPAKASRLHREETEVTLDAARSSAVPCTTHCSRTHQAGPAPP